MSNETLTELVSYDVHVKYLGRIRTPYQFTLDLPRQQTPERDRLLLVRELKTHIQTKLGTKIYDLSLGHVLGLVNKGHTGAFMVTEKVEATA